VYGLQFQDKSSTGQKVRWRAGGLNGDAGDLHLNLRVLLQYIHKPLAVLRSCSQISFTAFEMPQMFVGIDVCRSLQLLITFSM